MPTIVQYKNTRVRKCDLESRLLTIATEKPEGYREKGRLINRILNQAVATEMSTKVYNKYLELDERDLVRIFE